MGHPPSDASCVSRYAQVAATFGIPIARTDLTKRKREDDEGAMSVPPGPPGPSRGFLDVPGTIPLPAIHSSGGGGGRDMKQQHMRGRVSAGGYMLPKLLDNGGSKKAKTESMSKKDARGNRSSARSALLEVV